MNHLFKFGFILGVICLFSTLVLAFTYQVTKPAIERQFGREEQAALKEILPEAEIFNKKIRGELDYFEALKKDKPVGYCIKATGNGYGGFIRMIVGIDTNGMIKGVRILEHHETPGLGSRVNEVKPGDTDAWFLRQFLGKQAGYLEIKKDIDAVTGATISSRAITEAVNKTVGEFLHKKDR